MLGVLWEGFKCYMPYVPKEKMDEAQSRFLDTRAQGTVIVLHVSNPAGNVPGYAIQLKGSKDNLVGRGFICISYCWLKFPKSVPGCSGTCK